jgi:ABC-type phosphate/phosphonate transport system substrate-binding protein
MIANARMYSLSPQVADLWRTLLAALIGRAGLEIELIEHLEPAPIDELWQRADMAAVFMCGLPYSRAEPRPELVVAPVPSPIEFRGAPQYWSELVVRKDSDLHRIEDTFGGRLALTTPDSQSGCLAALEYLQDAGGTFPLYGELIAPEITPLRAMRAVASGTADVAPIDSYAFCLAQAYRPELWAELRVVAKTAPTPIPPLVASTGGLEPRALESLRNSFLEAHRIPALHPVMEGLKLQRFVRPDPAAYDEMRRSCDRTLGFWREHRLAAVVHPAFAALC